MSDTDSFIEEVTEEVRRDKLYGYVKKYGWIAVVAIFGIVGTTGYLEWQKSSKTAAAQALGNQIIAALDLDTPQERAYALAEMSGDAGLAQVLVDFRRASELVASDDKPAALEVLDQIASTATDPLYRDLAALKALVLRGSDMDSASRAAALETLAQPGKAFRPLAMEQQAVMAMELGDREKALAILGDVFSDSQSTPSLRSRVEQVITALGGEVPASAELLSGQ